MVPHLSYTGSGTTVGSLTVTSLHGHWLRDVPLTLFKLLLHHQNSFIVGGRGRLVLLNKIKEQISPNVLPCEWCKEFIYMEQKVLQE